MNKKFNKSKILIIEKESKSIQALNVSDARKQINNIEIIWI